MKRFANALIVIGVGVMSLLVLYSLKINRFNVIETSWILFLTGLLIISGLLIKTMINNKIMPREKLYTRIVVTLVYFTIITYNLIKNII